MENSFSAETPTNQSITSFFLVLTTTHLHPQHTLIYLIIKTESAAATSTTIMNPYIVGVVVPVVLTFLFRSKDSKRRRGVPVDAGGDTGVTVRNRRFDSPVETAWEGVTTLAELFEEACRKHGGETLLLGTRELISREVETGHDGRTFEKLHLGDYRWLSYADAFDAVSSFASGLAALGHATEQRAAIFADTREEWFLALQVRFTNLVIEINITFKKIISAILRKYFFTFNYYKIVICFF